MAMATRNTLTSVRPMISGPWAFCESYNLSVNLILQKKIWLLFAKVWRNFS